MLFWILAGLLLCAAVAVMLRPLLRADTGAEDADDRRLATYRARLSEIDGDVDAGSLAPSEADAVRREMEREFLRAAEGADVQSARRRIPAAAAVAVVVPACSILLYLALGQPGLVDGVIADRGRMDLEQLPPVEDMVAELAARMRRQPDDRRGWEILGRAYMSMGRYREAVAAMEQLQRLAPEDPEVLVRYADALGMTAGGSLAGRPAELVQRALALAPQHPTALWLAGIAASQSGDRATAIDYWERLLPLLGEDAEAAARVRAMIEETRTASADAAGADAAIAVSVELDPGLGPVKPGAVLFVTARSADGRGMPLAVARRAASELPLELTLSDADAMTATARLSDHETIRVQARISAGGDAERRSGDLLGEATDVPTGGGGDPITIVIDQRLP